MNNFNGLPPEKLSFTKKNKEWRQKHIDWAENYIWSYDSRVRKPLRNKVINYNLINGRLDMEDLELIVNPNHTKAAYIPDMIQHYPIINSKLNVLAGEESKRRFDFRLVVTNPDAISEIEENKKTQWMSDLSQWATQSSTNEEEAMRDLEKIEKYNKYEWQDIREIRGNCILKHYIKELSIPLKFNSGFYDAMTSGEEAYQCDIVGGEPTFERINPNKMIVLKSGFSNRIEDADMIVLWDYWSPGRIIDTYYDVLTDKDVQYINDIPFASTTDEMENEDPRRAFSFVDPVGSEYGEGAMIEGQLFGNNIVFDSNYTDNFGNIRVVRLYWKSYRKILKVKSYNFESGEEEYNFYPENYIADEAMGEEVTPLWVNEAWEATKIGKDIYVNMRPRVVQYNRLSNPSRCHFGIIGSVYNTNDGRPFSLVDMAKPYNYLYDVVHDRLNKNLAASWGKIMTLDLALVPKGWEIDKWMYYAKANHIAVKDSFKEGNKGAATGKLAGLMNNQSSGVIDANQGDIIQHDINLLSFIKMEMSEVMGISPQREGQVSNRETVGGVERSVLQSSHITEWLFNIHDDVKKRALECLLETAKASLRGRSMKFQYLLSDGALSILDIDGDEYAETDYGLLLDNSDSIQNFISKMEAYGQALIQNQMISTSTLFKLWDGSSISDIRRSVEEDERQIKETASQEREAQSQQFQADLEAKQAVEQEKMRITEENNIRDNETKVLIEQMKSYANEEAKDFESEEYDPQKKEELAEKIRQFNEKMKFDREVFSKDKKQQTIDNKFKSEELTIKRTQANKAKATSVK